MNKINHIAIIMDGNGRWGKKRGKSRNFGHLNGINVIEKIVKNSIKKKIPILTFYTFSTENWKRPKREINFLFKLIDHYFKKEIQSLIKNDIKINIIGNIKALPKKVRLRLTDSMRLTNKCKKIIINLAINYGSKNEIIQTAIKLKKKRIHLSMKNFEKNLNTNGMPNPDILIRTGGKKRLSNFLLWQLAYSELYFTDKLWPDFNILDYNKIIRHYKKVKRNFGTI
ncbi:MAG: di-trans,poly-cis-decaprenylcistransferase [Candidatus Marinimicrobia bacterium]|nr:di-trans,poly-cis-decaprenylcistransferase [Candidatus Neomarinimicrobiota bacterium]|tara:strand:+ start:4537 stop:5214 length:678 start_codon:yes stop_codon:yes gene_type:complete